MALLWETEGENKETALRMFANLAFTPIAGLNIKYTASKNIFNQIRGYYETKQHSSTTKMVRMDMHLVVHNLHMKHYLN